tara:strand:+ start:655 stop:2058 length:1404 start_codon:yes stop_codon:yes gene_type:complete
MSEKAVSDYLVIGAGAMGMAFTDVLIAETDATVTIVDRHARPGGHWNDAYPFVRLHQPSSFYGVNSRSLGGDQKDLVGGNAGLYELASGGEVVAYFEEVMNQYFLPSGRVDYRPMSEYLGNGCIKSLTSGLETQIQASKTVDATYMNVTVPSVNPPKYQVDEGAICMPPNGLVTIDEAPDGYVVVGGGKTAIDSCLWLINNGVGPELIMWIVPRDQWMLDRAYIQPGPEFADRVMLRQAETLEIVASSTSMEEMFDELRDRGILLQLDSGVRPTMYRCCTVTTSELDQLRQIQNVIRLGRVRRIGTESIELEGGEVPTTPGTVHIDCTSDGLTKRPVKPVFEGDRITLQTVRTCQQAFSAALVAHVEATESDEVIKNEVCAVVPHPDDTLDWVRTTLQNTVNSIKWNSKPSLKEWLIDARLDGFGRVRGRADRTLIQEELLSRIVAATPDALAKLEAYLREGRSKQP